ncbi:MAG TPA: HAMP domain-containing sensor histidine kinase [Chryseolinea sp.]
MRLLQVSLRSSLLYSLVIVLISIPVSLLSLHKILDDEVDELLAAHTAEFLIHIKTFDYLDDLETDLEVFDQLAYDIDINPSDGRETGASRYETISLYDSVAHERRPFRELSSQVIIKRKPYLLILRMSLVDNDELIYAIGLVQFALIVLLAGGLLLLNRSLSKKLWEPFYKTLSQLKAYQVDKSGTIAVVKTNIIEFDDLNQTVSHLAERNRKVFLHQKEFIENASHELQTPLAIFQAKLDLLMQKPGMSEAEAALITDLEATAQRMARLNKNLLLLSKIDNEQFTGKEEVEVSKLAGDLLSNITFTADAENVSITRMLEPLRIKANKALIEILLTNLFHNAVRHTPEGNVLVQLHEHTLTVTNQGKPLMMDAGKMFDRFTKESPKTSSTGLGLAIVKRICDTCGYGLSYRYENGCHVFSVVFNGVA